MGIVFIALVAGAYVGSEVLTKLCANREDYFFFKIPITNAVFCLLILPALHFLSESGYCKFR